VRLLRVSDDGFTLLLERCVPGTNLWSLGEEEANAVGAAILQQLWREPPAEAAFETVAQIAVEWCEEMPREAPAGGHDPALVEHAVQLARELAATQPRQVLVHGDFHPGNVLAAAREPWLAIDCKPLVGEPAYDLAQWFGNRVDAAAAAPDPVAAIRWQIDQFSRLLDLDPARIAGWAFVKSIGWDWGPPAARLLYTAMGGRGRKYNRRREQ
jgi:streptomycin 6-kinase